jgi:DNA-binding NarL/FixJ family response regulator
MDKPEKSRVTYTPVPSDKPPREMTIDGRRFLLVPLEQPATAVERSPLKSPMRPDSGVTTLLTARELQIVCLVAAGLVNKQIAAELSISEWTVSTHLRRIFVKLSVDTRAAMVARCFERPSELEAVDAVEFVR